MNRLGWWQTLLNDLSGEPRFPAPGLWAWKLLPLIFGILVTFVLVVGNYDLRIQQAIYRAGGDSWAFGSHSFWMFLYHAGTFPAIILGIAALFGLSLSWSMRRFGEWRRVYLFIALLLFLGPALIINFGLKDNWGRPRPIHVASMGGKQPFENVFVLNASREGKSFPCGHASTGFVLMAGFFVFCRHRRRLAYGWLISGAVFGTLLGVARMFQGGHFLTDVIWTALICYYSGLSLYYALGLKDSVWREAGRRHKMPVKVRLLILVVALFSLAGILLATPYYDDLKLVLDHKRESDVRINFRATLAIGRVDIVPAETFHISKKSSGHGVPTSRVSAVLWESQNAEGTSAHYSERQSGWFHELETETRIELPWDQIKTIQINNHSAEIFIRLGELNSRIPFEIGPGGGVIKVQLNGNRIVWDGGDRQRIKGESLLENEPEAEIVKGLTLSVSDEFGGVIELVE